MECMEILVWIKRGVRKVRIRRIVQLFARICKQAAISGASSHSGRRSFITALAGKQVNRRVIQVLARHSNLNTTMRYMDINDTKLNKAVELVSV